MNTRTNKAIKLFENKQYVKFVNFMLSASSPIANDDRRENITKEAKAILGADWLAALEDDEELEPDYIAFPAAEYLRAFVHND